MSDLIVTAVDLVAWTLYMGKFSDSTFPGPFISSFQRDAMGVYDTASVLYSVICVKLRGDGT